MALDHSREDVSSGTAHAGIDPPSADLLASTSASLLIDLSIGSASATLMR